MKPIIAHLIDHFLGISETFIYEYLTHVTRFNQLILTNDIRNDALFPFCNIISNKNVRRFSLWWFINGVDYRLHRRNGYFENRRYFSQQLKKRRVQLLHAHFGPQGVKALSLKSELNIPLVTTFYGYDITQLPRQPRWNAAYRTLFSQGDLFLVEGPVMCDRLLAAGCPPQKIVLQRIGIDPGKYSYRVRKLSDRVKFLFCGRFVEKKGLLDALAAFKTIAVSFPHSEFRIIGEGEQRLAVCAFIEEHHLQQQVKLLGMQPHQRIIREMENADILIQPSVTADSGDTEGGAPTVILEAQASGMIVISTIHADIPHIVAEPITEYLVPERNPERLANTMMQLMHDPARWSTLSAAGRTHIERFHDIHQLVPGLEEKLLNLLRDWKR